MNSLTRTIESIALAPRDARQIGEQRQPQHHQFRQAIQRLRLVEMGHVRAGRAVEAEQMRSVIDGLVAAGRRA